MLFRGVFVGGFVYCVGFLGLGVDHVFLGVSGGVFWGYLHARLISEVFSMCEGGVLRACACWCVG